MTRKGWRERGWREREGVARERGREREKEREKEVQVGMTRVCWEDGLRVLH